MPNGSRREGGTYKRTQQIGWQRMHLWQNFKWQDMEDSFLLKTSTKGWKGQTKDGNDPHDKLTTMILTAWHGKV